MLSSGKALRVWKTVKAVHGVGGERHGSPGRLRRGRRLHLHQRDGRGEAEGASAAGTEVVAVMAHRYPRADQPQEIMPDE